eukprot:scaffold42847_cov23-Cyclotella_meneghiniana.AAC.1
MMIRYLSTTCRKPLIARRASTSITSCQCIRSSSMSWHHNSSRETKPRITAIDGIKALASRAESFSTIATAPSTSNTTQNNSTDNQSNNNNNDSKNSETKDNKKKDDSNIFLDNLGKIFLSTIALVLLSLYRSNKGNNAKAALREEIEALALLDPIEIEDLRYSNEHILTKEVYDDILKEFGGVSTSSSSSSSSNAVITVTYGQFMKGVLDVLRRRHGEGATIQFGHLMDRVVVKELERIANEKRKAVAASAGGENDFSGEVEVPLSFLLTALSLALNSTLADRVQALYDVMLLDKQNLAEQTVSIHEVERMVQHLQSTCQLVPDAQIVPTIANIPYQMYRVGDGAELTRRACE